MISFNITESGFEIQVTMIEIEDDMLVVIIGGDRPHVGAVTVAQGFEKSNSRGTVTSISVPGHKEKALIEKPAKILAQETGGTVAVVGGVHYENIGKKGINLICELGIRAAERILQKET